MKNSNSYQSISGVYSRIIFIVLLFASLFLLSCEKNDSISEEKTKGFDSPDEYLQNPSVSEAINESNLDINRGDDFPALAGDYNALGQITNTSPSIYEMRGEIPHSLITLYNQTTSGKIDYRESVQGLTVYGSGGYITGSNGKFTIWQESFQTGSEAGLPDDLSINVVLIISGTKLSNGNLEASGISIITDAQSDNTDYNLDALLGIWWMWSAEFELLGEANTHFYNPNFSLKNCGHLRGISLSYIKFQNNEK